MRWFLPSLLGLLLAPGAAAAPRDVVHVAKPVFGPPLAEVSPSGRLRLRLSSTRAWDPAVVFPDTSFAMGAKAPPASLSGEKATHTLFQRGTTLVVYGSTLVAGFGPRGGMKYAFDLRSFAFPPRSLVRDAYGPQEISWARQLGRVLMIQTNHLGYAKESGNRNGYQTAIRGGCAGAARRSSRTRAASSSRRG